MDSRSGSSGCVKQGKKVRYLQEIFLEVAKSCQMQLYSDVSA